MTNILDEKYSYGDTEFAFQKSFYSNMAPYIDTYLKDHIKDFLNMDLRNEDLKLYIRAWLEPISELIKHANIYDLTLSNEIYSVINSNLMMLIQKSESSKLSKYISRFLIDMVPLDYLCIYYNLKDCESVINTGYHEYGNCLNALNKNNILKRIKMIDSEKSLDAIYNYIYLSLTNKNLFEGVTQTYELRKDCDFSRVFDWIIDKINSENISLNKNLENLIIALQESDVSYLATSPKRFNILQKQIIDTSNSNLIKSQLLSTLLSDRPLIEKLEFLNQKEPAHPISTDLEMMI